MANLSARDPRVAIVILNWKRPDHTLACLGSLARLDYPPGQVEIIVVDNGAPQGTPEVIRQRFPAVTLIENARNLGFAAGSNVGIAEAVRRGVDYVFLLNDDTEVAGSLLRSLVARGESDPAIGILGPKIYYFDEPRVIWSAGGQVGPRGDSCHRRVDQLDRGEPEAATDVDYVTGCAMLVKRQVIEAVGALDDRFFAYFEETEWCARARRVGYRVVYEPAGHVWHKIAPTERGRSRFYLYLMARNRLLYLKASGASGWMIGRAGASLLRTAASWRLRARHREMRPFAGALVLGVRDFLLGRYGAPPAGLTVARPDEKQLILNQFTR